MITQRLASEAHLRSDVVRGGDHGCNHPLHRVVPFVEQAGQLGRVTVDPERELGQVVAADRKPVDPAKDTRI